MNEDTETGITDPPAIMNTMTRTALDTGTNGHDTRGTRTGTRTRTNCALVNATEKAERTGYGNCQDHQMITRMLMFRRKK